MSLCDDIALEIERGSVPQHFTPKQLLTSPIDSSRSRFKIGESTHSKKSVQTNLNNLRIGPGDQEGFHVRSGRAKPRFRKHADGTFSLLAATQPVPEHYDASTQRKLAASGMSDPLMPSGASREPPDLTNLGDAIARYFNKRAGPDGPVAYLKRAYHWNFVTEQAEKEFGKEAVGGKSPFERTEHLREFLIRKLAQESARHERTRIACYFIREWGGIKTRKTPSVEVLVKKVDEVRQNSAAWGENLPLKDVSSWSKYLSLVCPEGAAIYDARVAYSLNAINYVESADCSVFPSPSGRNSSLGLLDIETLILATRLERDRRSRRDSANTQCDGRRLRRDIQQSFYIADAEAYLAYLQVLQSAHKKIFKAEEPLHWTEMLLFAVADQDLFVDVVQRVCDQHQCSGLSIDP